MATIEDGIYNAKDVKAAVKASMKEDDGIPEIPDSEWIKADYSALDKITKISENFFYEFSKDFELSGEFKDRETMNVRKDYVNRGFRATNIVQFLYDNCDHSTKFTNILQKISGYGPTANVLVKRLVAVLIPVKFQRIQRNIFMYIHKSQLEILVSALEYRHFYLISKILAAKAKLLPKFNDHVKAMVSNDREYAFCCGFDELTAEDKAWEPAKKSKGKIAEDGKAQFYTSKSAFSYIPGAIQVTGSFPIQFFDVSTGYERMTRVA